MMRSVLEVEEKGNPEGEQQNREHLLVAEISAKVGGVVVAPEEFHDETHYAIQH